MRVTIGATDYVNLNYVQFEESVVTGLEGNSGFNSIILYPNPFKESLFLNLNGEFRYQLLSFSGILLSEGTGNDITEIKNDFANGIYLLKVYQHDICRMFKVVKE